MNTRKSEGEKKGEISTLEIGRKSLLSNNGGTSHKYKKKKDDEKQTMQKRHLPKDMYPKIFIRYDSPILHTDCEQILQT